MEPKTYENTLSSLVEQNNIIAEKYEGALQLIERMHQKNDIARQKGFETEAKKAAGKNAYFAKVLLTASRELFETLSTAEKAFLFGVMLYLDYDNFVVDEKKQRVNMSGIAELLGMTPRNVISIMNSLEKKNVIKREDKSNSTYVKLNPQYINRKSDWRKVKYSCMREKSFTMQNRVNPSKVKGSPLFFAYISSLS